MRPSRRGPPFRRGGMHRDPRPVSPVITTNPPSIVDKPNNNRTRKENLALLSVFSERFHLPDEISIQILDYSERWIACSFQSIKATPALHIRSTHGEDVSKELLRTPTLTKETIHNLRKVSFKSRSRNQGHVGDPTRGNWSWFQMVLNNDALDGDEDRNHLLLCNEMLSPDHEDFASVTDHAVELQRATQIFGTMNWWFWETVTEGDSISIDARVRYRAWLNIVESASLTLWKVDDMMSDLPVFEEATEMGPEVTVQI